MSAMPGPTSKCQETAGFLFPHPCEHDATTRCDVSGAALCPDHAMSVAWGALEAAGLAAPAPDRPAPVATISATVARRLEERERAAAARAGAARPPSRWSSSPYFYRSAYFAEWGDDAVVPHDPDDFTAGDAEALAPEGPDDLAGPGDEAFEQDMGGS